MTLRFQKQEVGSWKLEVGFSQLSSLVQKRLVDLGTEKAPGTKLGKSNFQLPTSNFLFLKTEGHVFSNPLYIFSEKIYILAFLFVCCFH